MKRRGYIYEKKINVTFINRSIGNLFTYTAEGTAAATESKQETVDLANTEVSEETAEITYANFNASGGNEETLQKMYDAFHEEYPNITVNIETIGYDDYFTQMQTRVAGEQHLIAMN